MRSSVKAKMHFGIKNARIVFSGDPLFPVVSTPTRILINRTASKASPKAMPRTNATRTAVSWADRRKSAIMSV